MRILVVGAGETGATVIQQLRKNPDIVVMTLDPREDPYALTEGIIDSIDLRDPLTPLTLADIVEESKPDLILLASTSEDMGLGEASGIDVLTKTLQDEIKALSDIPIIEVARHGQ